MADRLRTSEEIRKEAESSFNRINDLVSGTESLDPNSGTKPKTSAHVSPHIADFSQGRHIKAYDSNLVAANNEAKEILGSGPKVINLKKSISIP